MPRRVLSYLTSGPLLATWHPVPGKPPWLKGDSSIDAIPADIEKIKLRAVSAVRFASIFERFTRLKGVEIDEPRDLVESSLSSLASLSELTWLKLNRHDLTGAIAPALAACTELRWLELAGPDSSSFDDSALAALGALTALEVLLLRGIQLDGKGVKALASVEKLHTLEMSGCRARPLLEPLKDLPLHTLILDSTADILAHRRKARIDDATLTKAALLPELCTLSARFCPKITGKGLTAFNAHGKLEELRLTQCQKVASLQAMEAIATMPALLALDMGGLLNMRGDQVVALAASKSLRALRLDIRGLQPGDLAHLGNSATLEHLLLEHTLPRGAAAPITAEDLQALAPLPLRTLQLPPSTVVDNSLVRAIARTSVQHLILDRDLGAPPLQLDTLGPLAEANNLRTVTHFQHPDRAGLGAALGIEIIDSLPYQSEDPTMPLRFGVSL